MPTEYTDETFGDKGAVKSAPTTNLVKQILLSDGRTISYEYDPEERITKVIDSVEGTTEYTYDAQGQLLTETVNGIVVNAMTYDTYGNILAKNGNVYTYGDAAWRDKLTAYNGEKDVYFLMISGIYLQPANTKSLLIRLPAMSMPTKYMS